MNKIDKNLLTCKNYFPNLGWQVKQEGHCTIYIAPFHRPLEELRIEIFDNNFSYKGELLRRNNTLDIITVYTSTNKQGSPSLDDVLFSLNYQIKKVIDCLISSISYGYYDR